MLKRVLDLAIAGAALVAAAPLFIVATAAVRLDSPGPIFFRQVRVGRDRKPIRTLKFRTMVLAADRLGPQLTQGNDPRVTRVGHILRKTKVDELPQLLNVLRGDMSLVGPRPEVPRYVKAYRPEWDKLFTVRPGITDPASVVFRDEERLLAAARDPERAYQEVIMPMKLQLALRGVEESSVCHDLGVVIRTIGAVLKPRRNDPLIAEALRRIESLNSVVS